MQPISIFGNSIQSVSPYISAQRRVNVYYHVPQDQDKNNIVICSTPGLTLRFVFPTSPIRGMIQRGQYAYLIAGNALYLLSLAGYSLLGTFGNQSLTPVGMSFNETQLFWADGITGYTLNVNNLISIFNPTEQVIAQELQFMFGLAADILGV